MSFSSSGARLGRHGYAQARESRSQNYWRAAEIRMVTTGEEKKKPYKGAIVSLLITWRNQKEMELPCTEVDLICSKLVWSDLSDLSFYNQLCLPTQTGGSSRCLWKNTRTWQSEWVSDLLIHCLIFHLASSLGPSVLRCRNFLSQRWCGCPSTCMCHSYLNNALR